MLDSSKQTILGGGSPDDKLRKEKKAQVQAWFHKEWDGYVRECEDDEDYAAEVIHGIASNLARRSEEFQVMSCLYCGGEDCGSSAGGPSQCKEREEEECQQQSDSSRTNGAS